MWTDVFHMRYPDTCESFSPAMSIINRSVFERDTYKQAPNEGKTADCYLPRIAKAMQKYHLQTQTHRYKRANSCQKLSPFRVLVRWRYASYFGLTSTIWTSVRSDKLTAAVAFRAAGTMAGKGADMLLPHIQR